MMIEREELTTEFETIVKPYLMRICKENNKYTEIMSNAKLNTLFFNTEYREIRLHVNLSPNSVCNLGDFSNLFKINVTYSEICINKHYFWLIFVVRFLKLYFEKNVYGDKDLIDELLLKLT